jgi:hypothetical protein
VARRRQEAVLQQPVRQRCGGGVGPLAPGQHRRRQPHRVGLVPHRRVGSQRFQQRGEGGKGRLGQTGGEGALAQIPIDQQGAAALRHLAVEPHLGGLADAVGQPGAGHERAVVRRRPAQAEGAGEHHRHDLAAPVLAPAQFAQHLDA